MGLFSGLKGFFSVVPVKYYSPSRFYFDELGMYDFWRQEKDMKFLEASMITHGQVKISGSVTANSRTKGES